MENFKKSLEVALILVTIILVATILVKVMTDSVCRTTVNLNGQALVPSPENMPKAEKK